MNDSELLAVFDAQGRKTGVKTRAAAHCDHDWHWLVFVWAAHLDAAGRAHTLLQVRARPGDPYLGSLDAPAAGHVSASETHGQGALREFGEEVGVELNREDLVYLGQHYLENPAGKCRRVIEHFYLCQRCIDLREVRFNEEVNGFVEVGLEDFIELLEGRRQQIQGRGRFAEQPDAIQSTAITAAALASYSELILDGFRCSMQSIRTYLLRAM